MNGPAHFVFIASSLSFVPYWCNELPAAPAHECRIKCLHFQSLLQLLVVCFVSLQGVINNLVLLVEFILVFLSLILLVGLFIGFWTCCSVARKWCGPPLPETKPSVSSIESLERSFVADETKPLIHHPILTSQSIHNIDAPGPPPNYGTEQYYKKTYKQVDGPIMPFTHPFFSGSRI